MKIKYCVCGLGYDYNNCITDHEKDFGEFNTFEEAKEHFVSIINKYREQSFELFDGLSNDIYYWLIQVEQCECTDCTNECVDVLIEDYIYNKEENKMVKSNKLFTPQEYLEEVTGEYFCVRGDDDRKTIETILKSNNLYLKSYSFAEIEHILENKKSVVLVQCMHYNCETQEFEQELVWFEVPENTKKQPSKPTKKFEVIVHYEGAINYTVKAEDEDEAIEIAENLFAEEEAKNIVINIGDYEACDCLEKGEA